MIKRTADAGISEVMFIYDLMALFESDFKKYCFTINVHDLQMEHRQQTIVLNFIVNALCSKTSLEMTFTLLKKKPTYFHSE